MTNGMLNQPSSEKEILMQTWVGILDKIHCPLFHDKSTDFRNTFERQRDPKTRRMLSFQQSSRRTLFNQDYNTFTMEQTKIESFPKLQFGVGVDEWLPHVC